MKHLRTGKTIDYSYDNEIELEKHKMYMVQNGWRVDSIRNYFVKNYVRYYKEIPEGVFL